MSKFTKTYRGDTLRSLLFKYSVDRSHTDPVFKAEFDAAQAEMRRLRAAAAKARAALMDTMKKGNAEREAVAA